MTDLASKAGTDNGVISGYKVFDKDWTRRRKQYACPGRFKESGALEICRRGMHFCQELKDCFNYYDFDPENRVAEVVAHGNIVTDGNKSCTDDLEIVRELQWQEVFDEVNKGKCCTGFGNTGDYNTGDWNAGDCNTGI